MDLADRPSVWVHAERFLRAIGYPSTNRQDPAQRLTQAAIPYLATLARLTPDDLQEMAIMRSDWRLRAITDVPFCAQCWIEGQRLHSALGIF